MILILRAVAARRAILRCQGNGFVLLQDGYQSRKRVDMTFDARELTGQ